MSGMGSRILLEGVVSYITSAQGSLILGEDFLTPYLSKNSWFKSILINVAIDRNNSPLSKIVYQKYVSFHPLKKRPFIQFQIIFILRILYAGSNGIIKYLFTGLYKDITSEFKRKPDKIIVKKESIDIMNTQFLFYSYKIVTLIATLILFIEFSCFMYYRKSRKHRKLVKIPVSTQKNIFRSKKLVKF